MTATEAKLTGEVSKVDRSIDRLKVCPLLLRVFWNQNRHHSPREYEQGHIPTNELQMYTWMDATLGELTQLIKEINPDWGHRGMQFSFAIVAADDLHNRYYLKDIGRTENGQRRSDDQIQLASTRFRIGSYLDVAIIPKRREQPPSASARHDRTSQKSSEDNNNKRRSGPTSERNGGGPTRSAPRNDHRDRPY